MKWIIAFICVSLLPLASLAQEDSVYAWGKKMITLRDVVLDKKIDIPFFIQKIQSDSSFYKAFKNLRILGFISRNDIRMLGKNGGLRASLRSKTRQIRANGCRVMQVLEQESMGDMFNNDGSYNYYSADMYASLFFTKGTVCGETNIIGQSNISGSGYSGMEKHKQQLKMLFFNPGKRIHGLPMIGRKTAIFDDQLADKYHFELGTDQYLNQGCYVLTQKAKPGKEPDVVVDEMTTWFNDSSYEVVARKYRLAYNAGLYDFDVQMEVQMGRFENLLVPVLIRYTGDWKVVFKKRERGIFTATLSDFEKTD